MITGKVEKFLGSLNCQCRINFENDLSFFEVTFRNRIRLENTFEIRGIANFMNLMRKMAIGLKIDYSERNLAAWLISYFNTQFKSNISISNLIERHIFTKLTDQKVPVKIKKLNIPNKAFIDCIDYNFEEIKQRISEFINNIYNDSDPVIYIEQSDIENVIEEKPEILNSINYFAEGQKIEKEETHRFPSYREEDTLKWTYVFENNDNINMNDLEIISTITVKIRVKTLIGKLFDADGAFISEFEPLKIVQNADNLDIHWRLETLEPESMMLLEYSFNPNVLELLTFGDIGSLDSQIIKHHNIYPSKNENIYETIIPAIDQIAKLPITEVKTFIPVNFTILDGFPDTNLLEEQKLTSKFRMYHWTDQALNFLKDKPTKVTFAYQSDTELQEEYKKYVKDVQKAIKKKKLDKSELEKAKELQKLKEEEIKIMNVQLIEKRKLEEERYRKQFNQLVEIMGSIESITNFDRVSVQISELSGQNYWSNEEIELLSEYMSSIEELILTREMERAVEDKKHELALREEKETKEKIEIFSKKMNLLSFEQDIDLLEKEVEDLHKLKYLSVKDKETLESFKKSIENEKLSRADKNNERSNLFNKVEEKLENIENEKDLRSLVSEIELLSYIENLSNEEQLLIRTAKEKISLENTRREMIRGRNMIDSLISKIGKAIDENNLEIALTYTIELLQLKYVDEPTKNKFLIYKDELEQIIVCIAKISNFERKNLYEEAILEIDNLLKLDFQTKCKELKNEYNLKKNKFSKVLQEEARIKKEEEEERIKKEEEEEAIRIKKEEEEERIKKEEEEEAIRKKKEEEEARIKKEEEEERIKKEEEEEAIRKKKEEEEERIKKEEEEERIKKEEAIRKKKEEEEERIKKEEAIRKKKEEEEARIKKEEEEAIRKKKEEEEARIKKEEEEDIRKKKEEEDAIRRKEEEERIKNDEKEINRQEEMKKINKMIEQIKKHQEDKNYGEAIETIEKLILNELVTDDLKRGYRIRKEEISTVINLTNEIDQDINDKKMNIALEKLDTILKSKIIGKKHKKELRDKRTKVIKVLKEEEKDRKQELDKISQLITEIKNLQDKKEYLKAIETIETLLEQSRITEEQRSDYTDRKAMLNELLKEEDRKEYMEQLLQFIDEMTQLQEEEKYEEAIIVIEKMMELPDSVITPEIQEKYSKQKEEMKQIPTILEQVNKYQEMQNFEEASATLDGLLTFKAIKKNVQDKYLKQKQELEEVPLLITNIKRSTEKEDSKAALFSIERLLKLSVLPNTLQKDYRKVRIKLKDEVIKDEEKLLADEMKVELESLEFDTESFVEIFDSLGNKLALKTILKNIPITMGVAMEENEKFIAKLKNPRGGTASYIDIKYNPRIPQRVYKLPVSATKGLWILDAELVKRQQKWHYEFEVVIEK